VLDNSRSLEKFQLEHRPPQPPLRKNSTRVWVLVHNLRVRFDLPSSIYFRDTNGVTNWRPRTFMNGHPRGFELRSSTIVFYRYDFQLVINCTRGRILHRFRNIASIRSNVAIFGYSLAFNPRRRGSPGTIYLKFCLEVSRWVGYKMVQKHWRKFQPAE